MKRGLHLKVQKLMAENVRQAKLARLRKTFKCITLPVLVMNKGLLMRNKSFRMRIKGFTWMILRVIPFLMLVSSCSSTSEGDALVSMMNSWNIVIPSWISGTDPCQNWEGINCNQNHVTSLNLTNKGLVGPVPAKISVLTNLISLDLSNRNFGKSGPWNRITGDISPIGDLTELQALNLSFNVLNTGFPDVVLRLTNLINLRIDNCNLTGPFPTGLSKLSRLEHIYLGNNSMTGALPSDLGTLVNLVELTLWNNPFNSSIPGTLGNLVKLTYLNLHNCDLWGGLPPELGNIKSMERLLLYSNSLTGPIPDAWQGMTNLKQLKLKLNFLSGQLPSWLLKSKSLIDINLLHNQLQGPFPVLNYTQLKFLNLDCNYFTGPWPVIPPHLKQSYEGNCFSNITADNDNTGTYCKREGTCQGFLKQTANGGCPRCPGTQVLLNKTLCICGTVLGASISSGNGGSSNIGVVVGPIIGSFVFVILVIIGYFTWRKSKNHGNDKYNDFFSVREIDEYWEVPKGLQRYTLEDLSRATEKFDKSHEIGSGGFGKVFFGNVGNGKMVAIKRASFSSTRGSSEFRTEVQLLSRLHHRNLVHLEGFCDEGGFQILVYEYMPNGNLHTRLSKEKTENLLSWYKRLEIAVGIAEGLEYLHTFADPPVIHRDVKPSNILLDENLIAKLADFGLSRANVELNTHLSTRPAGTAGYIDPQYFLRQKLTTASDVYAFGVVLLELITGQKAIDQGREEDFNLVEWAKAKLTSMGIKSIVDPLLGEDYPENVYFHLAELAINCASFKNEDRPSMKAVVNILANQMQELQPPPAEAPVDTRGSPSDTSYENLDTSRSTDFTSSSVELSIPGDLSSSIIPR